MIIRFSKYIYKQLYLDTVHIPYNLVIGLGTRN